MFAGRTISPTKALPTSARRRSTPVPNTTTAAASITASAADTAAAAARRTSKRSAIGATTVHSSMQSPVVTRATAAAAAAVVVPTTTAAAAALVSPDLQNRYCQNRYRPLAQRFSELWQRLNRGGWRAVKGRDLVDWYYVKPGCSAPPVGALGIDCFDSMAAVVDHFDEVSACILHYNCKY
jgi:hypothetical protein